MAHALIPLYTSDHSFAWPYPSPQFLIQSPFQWAQSALDLVQFFPKHLPGLIHSVLLATPIGSGKFMALLTESVTFCSPVSYSTTFLRVWRACQNSIGYGVKIPLLPIEF